MSTNRYQGQDLILSNVAIGYTNDAYVAGLLLPEVPVNFQTGKHWIYDQARFSNTPSKRATGSESGEVELTLTSGLPYFCEDHALKQFVPDEDVENATTPTDPFTDATENVSERLLIAREVEAATLLTSTANITQNTTLSGTSQFSDYSNSDPFTTIETGKQTIHSATHLAPNVAVMGKQAWDKLKYHPALMERVKYSQRAQMTPDLVASLLEIDKIIVAAAEVAWGIWTVG
ncbi:MAG: major capsid protein [Planctomycetota bacterium]